MLRPFLVLLTALMLAVLSPTHSRAEPVDAGHAVVELISERQAIAPGDRFLAGLKMELDEGWHVYWRNAGDAGIPPSIRWDETVTAQAGEFTWPSPHTIPLEGLMNYGYGEEVIFPFEVVAPDTLQPGDSLTLSGLGEWQICLDICIWEDAPLSLTLPVEAAPRANDAGSADIMHALDQAPGDLAGEAFVERDGEFFRLGVVDAAFADALNAAKSVRFFPYDHPIEHFPEQALTTSDQGGVLTLEASSSAPDGAAPLAGVIVVEQGGETRPAFRVQAEPGAIPAGLGAAAFTPSETAHGGGKTTTGAAGFGQILAWLAFGAIGGLILNLMPCVLPVLSIKANGLMHAASQGDQSIRSHGLAYFAGVVVCFLAIGLVMVALRAAGQQAGLGFQLQYPPIVLGLAFLMFLIGLNLLGVFEIGSSLMGAGSGLAQKSGTAGAFFTGLLAAVVGAPCVGPFLAASLGAVVTSQPAWVIMLFMLVMGAGMAAPFLILSFFPQLARALPKPGRWMDTMKQVLAFPMFLTAVGLLWVFAGQAGSNAAMIALAGGVVAVFGIWILQRADGAKTGLAAGGALLLAGVVAPIVMSADASAPSVETAATSRYSGDLERANWSPEKVAELQAAGRPFFVDFTARWCVTCQFNKKTTLQHPSVEAAFAENDVVFLTADWTNRDDIIAAELAKRDRAGVPLYLFFPPGETEPVTLPQLLRPQIVIRELEAAMRAAQSG